jgi:hypothetical protein
MSVELSIEDETLSLPSRFYHILNKLQTVVKDFSFETKIGPVKCVFTSEYLEVEGDEETSDVEEILSVYIKIDKTEHTFAGEEFWEQFTSAKVKESKNSRRFSRFIFKDQGSGIIIKRTAKGSGSDTKTNTVLEVFNAQEKEPYISMNVNSADLRALESSPVRIHENVMRILSFF